MGRGLEADLRGAALMLRHEAAASRFALASLRLRDALLELRYNPDWPSQPRVPAGDSAGGQWTDRGAGSSPVLVSATKPDIKAIEYLLSKYGIFDRKTRRRIHDDITRQDMSLDEIESYISGFAK